MPPTSRLLTGDDGLHVLVRGIASLRATLPAFSELRGGELALISPGQALALDERLTLPHMIGSLAQVPVAAIAVAGAATEGRAVALQANIPLIELPSDTDLRTVERDATRLMLDPDLQIERWASQLYSELTHRVVDGAGVSGVIARLSEVTGLSSACYTPSGRLRAQHTIGAARAVFEILRPESTGEHHLLGHHVYVTAISDAGWLALAGQSLDRWDQLAARQGAAALALELSKEQAVKDAEARVRGDLVRTILSGTPVDTESINSQAAELGYQLDQPHIALVIASAAGDQPPTLQVPIERLLSQRKLTAPLLLREDSVLVFVPVTSNPGGVHALLDTLNESHPVAAGISAIASTAAQWAHALDEAEQALVLGRQLFGSRSITAFNDLGVYRLLVSQRESPELWRFYRDTLGRLLDYGPSSGDLIETLEGYFLARGNVSRAAALLHVHRNTLIYRLQRIAEIADINWEHAEDQLALQLALKAHRVLRMGDSGNGARSY